MTKTKPGRFYGRTWDDRLEELPGQDHAPDVWICRRVTDYPGGALPAGAAPSVCTQCGAAIAFNPKRSVDAPKICMQCGGIQPLPIAR
jgi:hypothetical protein